MEILAWLLPSAIVLVVMMAWATWAGRPRREETDRSEEAYERFAQAIARPHPTAGRRTPPAVRDRSTGIAVRPSRRPNHAPAPLRNASGSRGDEQSRAGTRRSA